MPRSTSLANPAADWKKFHATTSLIETLLALVQFGLMLCDVINYNDITSATCSHEYAEPFYWYTDNKKF